MARPFRAISRDGQSLCFWVWSNPRGRAVAEIEFANDGIRLRRFRRAPSSNKRIHCGWPPISSSRPCRAVIQTPELPSSRVTILFTSVPSPSGAGASFTTCNALQLRLSHRMSASSKEAPRRSRPHTTDGTVDQACLLDYSDLGEFSGIPRICAAAHRSSVVTNSCPHAADYVLVAPHAARRRPR